MSSGSKYLNGKSVTPKPFKKDLAATEIADKYFQVYNARPLSEACHIFVEKLLECDLTIGMSVRETLMPAGLSDSCIVTLTENGLADWIINTSAIVQSKNAK